MKISEVCRRTGLTQRTVRFYEEKGLISPNAYDKNGKSFREYNDEDVKRLYAIADLRRLEFSVDEIVRMTNEPGCIGELVRNKHSEIALAQADLSKASDTLDSLSKEEYIPDILAVSDAVHGLSGLDSFGIGGTVIYHRHIDEDTNSPKSDTARHGGHSKIKRLIKLSAICTLICFAVIYAISWIPETVYIERSGELMVCSGGSGVQDTVTQDTFVFKGKIYRPLFANLSGQYVTGDFKMANTPAIHGHCTTINTEMSKRGTAVGGIYDYDSYSFDYSDRDRLNLSLNSEDDGYDFLIYGDICDGEGKTAFEFTINGDGK